ncbi:sulfatase family protein [Botrimarina hoheduenensis]|uniref:Arylsulfatase n=1 Tax=Botrimarina hoheduenensis TaxID=2528000 RepID=A0A5C5W9J6_9BACT|nr:sulfatase [Botrimarina hoheduenensis]TWT47548.1 Arylsulfatase [Botrimarina hoheduenensis]
MNRYHLVALIGLALMGDASAAPRPNFVFIMSDDHAYQAVSAYGHGLNETPQIDRLASEGIRFDRCYVANSICGPSRACLLTGKHSHANGVLDNFTEFDGAQWTFPKSLRQAGYQTAIIGKWHLKSDPTGFDHWDILPGQGKYYRPDFRTAEGLRAIDGYVTHVTTDLAIEWLEGAAGPGGPGRAEDKPFLLILNQKAPHRPWDPAPEHLETFAGRTIAEPATLLDDYATRTTAPRTAEMRIADHMRVDRDVKAWARDSNHREWLYKHMSDEDRAAWERVIDRRAEELAAANLQGADRTRWIWRHYMEDYLACIASVDEGVGRVLDWLDAADLNDNTVVVYTSDQGFYLGEHGWFDKRFMYEQSLRTPMVLRWPAGVASPGRSETRIVSNLDFAPTFLELAGAEADPTLHGESMVPLLTDPSGDGPSTPGRDIFYYHYHEGPTRDHAVERHDGVTDGTHKLICFYDLGEWELYDLSTDPDEMLNRYEDPAYQSERERLTQRLLSERNRLGVVVPQTVPTEQPAL